MTKPLTATTFALILPTITAACISNMDEQKLTVCEELMKIQIAFFEELGMQKIADHCVRIMEDYRKGIGKQKESDCR